MALKKYITISSAKELPVEMSNSDSRFILNGHILEYVGQGGNMYNGLYEDIGILEDLIGRNLHSIEETNDLEVFHSLSSLMGRTESEKSNMIPSGLVVKECENIICGDSAIEKIISGYRLYGKTGTTTAFYATAANWSVYIYDVTSFVGGIINLYHSKISNSTQYKIVSDYSVIGTSSLDISSVLLASGPGTSNSSNQEKNCYNTQIPLTTSAIVEQASIGKVYVIINLRNNFKQKELYRNNSILNRLNGFERTKIGWNEEEINRIGNLIKKRLNHQIVIIGFNTDQHISHYNREVYEEPVLRGLNDLRIMAERLPFSLICLGGDAPGYHNDNTQDIIDEEILEVIESVYTDRCPVVYISGNHDAFQNLIDVSMADGISMFNVALKGNIIRRIVDGFNNRSTNCWYDDNANKIRFVFLDSWARADGPKNNNNQTYSAMLSILSEALSDDKLLNSDWGVVIFSHNVLTSSPGNNLAPMSSTYWNTVVKPRIDAGLNLIACFNGHSHKDSHGLKDGHLFICSQQSAVEESNESFDGVTYNHLAYAKKETSFDVFVIDKTEGKIYAYKYGAGMDRLFYYGNNARIALCNLSGKITIDGENANGTIIATHHNTIYSSLLVDGNYNFPYLCPECVWNLAFGEYSEEYLAEEGNITKDIVL